MPNTVYFGGLSYNCTKQHLEKFLKGYGRIIEISLHNGFGLVEFEDYRDADDAVFELNGKELLHKRVTVEFDRRKIKKDKKTRGGSWIDMYGPRISTGYRIIVSNLSSLVDWQDLKDYMLQAGEITYVDAHTQKKNEGVVEFSSYSGMKNALHKLNDTELKGQKIHLIEDFSQSSSRSRSRSRSSHSRSNSRSRSRSSSECRSVSHDRSGSRSPARDKEDKKSRSRSRSPLKSQSRSPLQ